MKNYDKYLTRANSRIPKDNLMIIKRGTDIALSEVFPIDDKNKLLEEGYLSTENGYHHHTDRSAFAAVLTDMPNVTIEMIDWWFWWHAKESVRYQLWYPEMHFGIESDFGGHYDDVTMSYRERLHLSTHYVTEDIGMGKEKIAIDFMSPATFGFNQKQMTNEKDQTIICARVGDLSKRVWHTRMCHQVRKKGKGVEMRSRFWMAQKVERMDELGASFINKLLNNSFIKGKLLPKGLGRHMFHHCTQEYNNLAEILPELYNEEVR